MTIQASKTSVLHETSRKSELRSKHSALQIPIEQRDSTPRKHHSETANPNMTTTQTCPFHETLRLCSEMHHLSCMTYHFYANHNGIAAQTDTRHVHEKSLFGALPNGRAIGAGFEHLRTVADGCERLRTVANGCEHKNNDRRTQLYPQTPKVKREPFATHSGKHNNRLSWRKTRVLSAARMPLLGPELSGWGAYLTRVPGFSAPPRNPKCWPRQFECHPMPQRPDPGLKGMANTRAQ